LNDDTVISEFVYGCFGESGCFHLQDEITGQQPGFDIVGCKAV
jgi:hypothetical protein